MCEFSSSNFATMAALNRSQAITEFGMNGKDLQANPNFPHALGYAPSKIIGIHHSIFVESSEVQSAVYKKFWADLRRGEFERQCKRIGKNGKDVRIEARYNAMISCGGRWRS